MRQSVRRGVAPLNTNPKWPQGYVAVLRESGAHERAIPFLVTWVRRFFARFPGRSRRSLGRVEIETFLVEMVRHHNISNWQIAQARDALELYYEQFRGIALAARPDGIPPDTASQHPPTSAAKRDDDMPPSPRRMVEAYRAGSDVGKRKVGESPLRSPRLCERLFGCGRRPRWDLHGRIFFGCGSVLQEEFRQEAVLADSAVQDEQAQGRYRGGRDQDADHVGHGELALVQP